MGTYGLVYGVILGAALHLAIQIPALIKYQFHWTATINLRDPRVIKVLTLLGPRAVTMLCIQLVTVWRNNLASGLATGSVTALTYGWMIMQVPETVLGTAVGTAMLPTLAEQYSRSAWLEFKQSIERAVQVLTAVSIPIAVIMSLGLLPLVQVVFKFGEQGSLSVMWVTQAYLAGLLGYSLNEVASRGFYARQDARLPLLASFLSLIAFGIIASLLVKPFGAVGIALGVILASTGETLFLLILLDRRLPEHLAFANTLVRSLVAGLVGGIVTYLILTYLPLSPVIASLAAMALGAAAAVPFIWKEIRLLVRL
jgi:putative peptidoglycan lipid II flippase